MSETAEDVIGNGFSEQLKSFVKKQVTFLVTVAVFIVFTIVFYYLGKKDGVYSELTSLAMLSRFVYVYLLLVFAVKFGRFLLENRELLTKGVASKNSKKRDGNEVAAADAKPEEKSGLEAKKSVTTKPVKAKPNAAVFSDALVANLIKVVYACGLFAVAFAFLYVRSTRFLPYTTPVACAGDIVHIIVLLVYMVVLFILQRWVVVKADDPERHLLSGLLLLVNISAAATLLFTCLNYIFSINYLFALSWIYYIINAYVVLGLAFGTIKLCIKKQFGDDFDCRLLPPHKGDGNESLLDTIERYTGLSFKSLWSIKFIVRLLPSLVFSVGLILLVSTCFYKVESYETAVVYRFGALQEETICPGLHVKLPFFIDKVEIYETERAKSMQIGYISTGGNDFLWTEAHDGGEEKLLLGNGTELVSVNIKLTFHISDLPTYLKNYASPESVLAAKAYNILMMNTANSSLDAILSVDRSSLSALIKTTLNEDAAALALGISVDDVVMESIHPPTEIADAYQSVVSAQIEKRTKEINAETYAAQTETQANATKETVVQEALQNQSEKLTETISNLAVYTAAYEAYRTSPESFVLSEYLDTYEVVLASGAKIYLFSPTLGGTDNDLSNYLINGDGTGVVGALVGG